MNQLIKMSRPVWGKLFLSGLLGAFLLASCSKKMIFSTSAILPAATGSVKVSRDKNKNYSLNLSAVNMAPPDRLTPPYKFYVVWVETPEDGVKNLGQLVSSNSLISKTLKASFKTTTPYKPVRVFITAENEVTVTYPGNLVVLSTR
jgi:multidrug efflux pump subunit AcrA (membrane-fusion protein)